MIKNTFITIQIRYISYKKIYKKRLENENKAKNIMPKGKKIIRQYPQQNK